MNIASTFKKLWLSNNEIELYLVLLQWGRQSTTTLSRKLNKPRTTLYTHIDWLSKKWFIQIEQTARGKRFNALSFDNLLIAIEQKQKRIGDVLSDFIEVREEYDKMQLKMSFLPKVKVYETKEARNIVYKKIQQFKEAYSIFNYDAAIEFLARNKKRREQVGTVPQWAYVKEILIDSPHARKYKKKWEKVNRWYHEIRLANSSMLDRIQSDILLVDWIYYHTSLTERITMIEINDPIFYQSQKALFDILWKNLE